MNAQDNEFTALFSDFQKLPREVIPPQTFLELAGYPQLENVCSNILAFFFNPREQHNLGACALDALLRVVKAQTTLPFREEEFLYSKDVSVDREIVTENKKRIDLLISSQRAAILVENKLFHDVNNPLEEYGRHLERREIKANLKLILHLQDRPLKPVPKDYLSVTYEQFFTSLLSGLPEVRANGNAKYLIFLEDFIVSILNLSKTTKMSARFIKFLCEHQTDLVDLEQQITQVRKEMRSKLENLSNKIGETEYPKNTRVWWYKGKDGVYDILVFDISVTPGDVVYIDAAIYPEGWWLTIGFREKNKDIINPKAFQRWLEKAGIKYLLDDGEYYYQKQVLAPYDGDDTPVCAALLIWLRAIKKFTNSK